MGLRDQWGGRLRERPRCPLQRRGEGDFVHGHGDRLCGDLTAGWGAGLDVTTMWASSLWPIVPGGKRPARGFRALPPSGVLGKGMRGEG